MAPAGRAPAGRGARNTACSSASLPPLPGCSSGWSCSPVAGRAPTASSGPRGGARCHRPDHRRAARGHRHRRPAWSAVPAIIGTPPPERPAQARRATMMQRMVEARAILQENQQLKAALRLREHSGDAVAVGPGRRLIVQSPRRFAILSVGSRRRRRGRHAGARARRARRANHRRRRHSPAGCCWSPTAPTSSRRGSCGAASR